MPERARGSFRPRAAGQRSSARSASCSACHLVALDWHRSELPSRHCSAGSFSEKLWLAPNRGHFAETQAFVLVASGKGTAKGEFFVRLAPAPAVMVTTTTVAPTTSATATAPVTSVLHFPSCPVVPVGPLPVTPSGTTTTTSGTDNDYDDTTTTTRRHDDHDDHEHRPVDHYDHDSCGVELPLWPGRPAHSTTSGDRSPSRHQCWPLSTAKDPRWSSATGPVTCTCTISQTAHPWLAGLFTTEEPRWTRPLQWPP